MEQTGGLESKLSKAANALRKNVNAAEYKHIVLGLIFLKHISDSFDARREELEKMECANLENPEAYRAENVFWVPIEARWERIRFHVKQTGIGKYIDAAMEAIEQQNANSLKGILPRGYAEQNVASATLIRVIELIDDLDLDGEAAKSRDLLGRVYEYFLGQFALAEGAQGGQFYTPSSIVKLLVEMIEPYKGRVYDPCCGSGGMFVMSEKFVERHQGRVADISIFGQESNLTTHRLCLMNLAIRHIDGSQVKWNADGSFLKDEHPDLKADFVLANPPFNDKAWEGKRLRGDSRWKYGVPTGNANFAWVQHFIHHLGPEGAAGFVLSKGSLTSNQSNDGVIRKNIVEAGLVDCIVNLPAKLFMNTQIPACLWFVSNKGDGYNGDRKRKDEILFIDAGKLGHLVSKKHREFSNEDIEKVANVYHQWRKQRGEYRDITGFCNATPMEKVRETGCQLSPGRYVGLPDDEDDFDFDARFAELKAEFEAQIATERQLNKRILKNLEKVQQARCKDRD